MNIQLYTKNIEASEYLKKIVDEKLNQHLEKYLQDFAPDIKTANVKVEKLSRWGYEVSFDMWLPGREHIFAKAIHKELAGAILELREELEREIEKYKSELQG